MGAESIWINLRQREPLPSMDGDGRTSQTMQSRSPKRRHSFHGSPRPAPLIKPSIRAASASSVCVAEIRRRSCRPWPETAGHRLRATSPPYCRVRRSSRLCRDLAAWPGSLAPGGCRRRAPARPWRRKRAKHQQPGVFRQKGGEWVCFDGVHEASMKCLAGLLGNGRNLADFPRRRCKVSLTNWLAPKLIAMRYVQCLSSQ